MKLYLIRHAQSMNNAGAGRGARVSDPRLTELGERQAQALADFLATGRDTELRPGEQDSVVDLPYQLTRLYCSAMTRALQTSHPISQALNVPVVVWPDIHEQGGVYLHHEDERGVVGYPGKTRREILTEYPHYTVDDPLAEALTDEGWWRGSYEEMAASDERAARVVETIRGWAAGSDERIAILSHGTFMNSLIKTILGLPPASPASFPHYNTAISKIHFRPNGRIVVEYTNRIDFLPSELLS